MYFYEVLAKCSEDILTEEFLKLCKDSPDIQKTRDDLLSVLETLKNTDPDTDGNMTIFIENVEAVDGSFYDAVRAQAEGDPVRYGLEANPWADTIGYLADGQSVKKYGNEAFCALVIWEMTYLGFYEDKIRQRVKEWNDIE